MEVTVKLLITVVSEMPELDEVLTPPYFILQCVKVDWVKVSIDMGTPKCYQHNLK